MLDYGVRLCSNFEHSHCWGIMNYRCFFQFQTHADDTNCKSEETDIATLFPVEPILEVLEDRVVIVVENVSLILVVSNFLETVYFSPMD